MVEYTKLTESEIVNLKKVFKDNYNNTSEMIADKNGRKKGGGKGGAINHSSSSNSTVNNIILVTTTSNNNIVHIIIIIIIWVNYTIISCNTCRIKIVLSSDRLLP